ncbi:double-strand break repair helicase AddA [Cognatishimia sp. F0-27]|uniref:double-strand break repair helicase AddA n=1 Tax=Cognatishimia sp. F0-27 TaxID=2816855 RepID=UPI001D0CCC80|nr:double-strand break repair helicase AddA [Cognatishimia sp. F0-27]MCC1491174.1 double-strand break repair helicase AddA [Cognatishimia sp. F0-27]
MTDTLPQPDAATLAQLRAAEPDLSTWLSANAGSGKTRVLTDRVARLLLGGVLPEHILCLTYTKAAATEMQNRLFKRLGEWAMLDADDLRRALSKLGVTDALTREYLNRARTLFARAIETPGGLRIQTIHAFCASLLRRFPLEAGVSPQFTEMEDRAAERLRAEIADQMAAGPEAALVTGIAPFLNGDDIEPLTRAIVAARDDFAARPDAAQIRAAYGLAPDMDAAQMLAEVFVDPIVPELKALVPALQKSGANDKKLATVFDALTGPDLETQIALEGVFVSGAKTKDPFTPKIGKVPTKGFDKISDMTVLRPRIDALMERIAAARETRLALAAAERDMRLHAFARAFLPAYEQAKQVRGWLDFDDLITRALHLLSDPVVAEWVLFRLDGGIDHILVDEAQDTSPVQWQVIERLAREFTSGQGANAEKRRTIFVVGDKKQSIYSFQGADPSEFDRMRAEFAARLADSDAPLQNSVLSYSFRSAEPILRLVDTTFDGASASGFAPEEKHRAFKSAMPGRVDLWPVVAPDKEATGEDNAWFEPVDRISPQHHSVVLARRIAAYVRGLIENGHPLPEEIGQTGDYARRPVTAGDVLILVRSRGRLFHEIIRACKAEGLPFAGADRLKVMEELAVRDIVSLLRFLATPEDDLALAEALRSPLLGLSEQDLFALAHGRAPRAYLWEQLRKSEAAYPETVAMLRDLRGHVDFLRPYDLIERILTRFDGRRRLTGRLGPQAQDGIDALLSQALAYERSDIPSLTGFLQWAETDTLEIKRAADSAGDRLRVMTMHGAKGLEAPVVILPDCAPPRGNRQRDLLLGDAEGAMWKALSDDQPARQRAAIDAAQDADTREEDRLLYVGMTRAEKWLIVAAAGDLGRSGTSWYDMIERGMQASGAVTRTFDWGRGETGEGLGLGETDWSGLPPAEEIIRDTPPAQEGDTADPVADTALPAQFTRMADPPEPARKTHAPSDLGGAKALAGADGDTTEVAMARGTALHLLLEWLAPLDAENRAEAADRLIAAPPFSTDPHAPSYDLLKTRDEALAVLASPDLAFLFGPDSLSEVPISAELSGVGRIHGVIDRLIVTPETVTAVDFKSNRTVPSEAALVPEGLLRQLGAYAVGLTQLYPGRRIETGLVWTATSHYMPVPHERVTQALERAAIS